MHRNRRQFLSLSGLALAAPSLFADQDPNDIPVCLYEEEPRLAGLLGPKDPDLFGLEKGGFPIIENSPLSYRSVKVALRSQQDLYLGARLSDLSPKYVYRNSDGAYLFFFRHRKFHDKSQVRAWKKIFIDYVNRTDLNAAYWLTAAAMFGTWVITSETVAPWIGLTANALGTWDFLVSALNAYRHVKQAEEIIRASDMDSFVVTRLEIIPHDSSKCRLAVFFQGAEGAEAVPLWAQSYDLTSPAEFSSLDVEGWA